MWMLLQPGRRRAGAVAVVPDPHLGPALRRRRRPRGAASAPSDDFFDEPARGLGGLLAQAPGDRAVVPAQPDHHVRRPRLHAADRRLRPRAATSSLVHDFAYADLGFDGYRPAVDPPGRGGQGGRRRAVLDDEVVLDGRLAGGVPGRQRRGRRGAGQAQELPRLRHVPAHPDRGHRHAERGARLPRARSTRSTRAGATRSCDGLAPHRLGDRAARGARCSSGRRSPSPTRRWARSSSPRCWCRRPRWRSRPGVGFGPGGEGYVRFALIENEQRIGQAVRNLRRALTRLEA